MRFRACLSLGLVFLLACSPASTNHQNPTSPESLVPAQQTSAMVQGLYSPHPREQLGAIRAMAKFPDLAKLHQAKIVELQSSPHPNIKLEANKIAFPKLEVESP